MCSFAAFFIEFDGVDINRIYMKLKLDSTLTMKNLRSLIFRNLSLGFETLYGATKFPQLFFSTWLLKIVALTGALMKLHVLKSRRSLEFEISNPICVLLRAKMKMKKLDMTYQSLDNDGLLSFRSIKGIKAHPSKLLTKNFYFHIVAISLRVSFTSLITTRSTVRGLNH